MKKIAIVLTHPIQYYVPIFVELTKGKQIDFQVFYSGGITLMGGYDPEFRSAVQWNIPLLDGYPFVFCENEAEKPGSDRFEGIRGPDLIHKIDEYKPDAILIFGYSYNAHLNLMRHCKNRIPVFFRGDSHLNNKASIARKIVKWLYLRYVFSLVDYALYVGAENKKYYKFAGLKEQQLFYVPHAIDNNRFRRVDRNAVEDLKGKLGLNDADSVLLFVGKLDANKNVRTLIEAFNLIAKETFKLIIVGVGVQYETLKKSNLNPNILFAGFVNQQELPSYYHVADCLVLPSINETWGLVVNEAMAAGLTVICSKSVGASSDLIVEGRTGYTFDPNNKGDLYRAFLRVFEDSNHLLELKQNANSHIEKFSMNVLIQSLTKSITTVLGK